MANALDTYLETIAQGSMEKKAAQETFGPASVEELAKVAGISLAENVCTSCGSSMEKLGSIYRCECGMLKKAQQLPEPEIVKSAMAKCGDCGMEKRETADGVKCGCGVKVGADEQFVEPGRQRGMRGALNALTGSPSGLVYKQDAADRVQSGALKGLGIGAGVGGVGGGLAGALSAGKKERLLGALAGAVPGLLAGGLLGTGIGAGRAESGYLKDRGITSKGFFMPKHRFTPEAAGKYLEPEEEQAKEGSLVKAADFAKAAEAVRAFEGDLEKVATYLEAEGMSKEAIMGVLKAIGATARGTGKALMKGQGGRALKALKGGGARIGREGAAYGKGVANTARTAYQGAGGGAKGVWEATKGLAKTHPELAVAGGAGLGAGAYKMASAEEVGDAAGRILAKAAALDMDELRESVEEAKEREDIPGRAKSWQIGGGVAGGAAGGAGLGAAGIGLSKMLGKGRVALPLAGAALGGLAGGAAGQHFGKQHGAEEAAADKMVSMLRALRAHRMGAQAGGQAGYNMGYQHGQGAGE